MENDPCHGLPIPITDTRTNNCQSDISVGETSRNVYMLTAEQGVMNGLHLQ